MSSYLKTLCLAGATIIKAKTFGDWQGTLLVKVNYQGKTGWLSISYGSCSMCDSYQASFNNKSHDRGDEYHYDTNVEDHAESCMACKSILADMKAFGENYLQDLYTEEELLKRFILDLEWDSAARKTIDFIKGEDA